MDDTPMRFDPQDEIRRLHSRLDRVEKAAAQSKTLASSTENRLLTLDSDLAILTDELRTFTQQIARLSLMTESRNRIHVLEHELDARFGRHAAIRKLAADLLHSAGGPLWSEVVAQASGAMPGMAREYWLASAALAFAAWMDDDRSAAERRVAESLMTDNSAAALFFCLIAHRFGRTRAATQWFKYYVATLDASAMPHGAVQVFLAACDGVFGAEAARAIIPAAREWVAAERARQEAAPVELEAWKWILSSKFASPDAAAFPLLREHCPQWPDIEKSLELTALQSGLTAFYRQLTDNAHAVDADVPIHYEAARPEAILKTCVQSFLEEEKPLRRDRVLSWIIIEENGDLEAANTRMEREWAEETDARDFMTLLAEITGVVVAAPARTRRLAFGLAFPWLDMAYESLREEAMRRVPASFELKIGNWSGRTSGGENDSDLLASYSRHLDGGRDEGKGQLPWLDEKLIVPGVLMLLLVLLTASTIIIPLCAMGGFGYYFYLRTKAVEGEKAARGKVEEDKRRDGMALLTACLGEVKAYRKSLLDKNREMDVQRERMRSMDFPVAESEGGTEREPAEEAVRSAALPVWDLEPPTQSPANRSE